jgi:hypothetical protein
METPDWVSKNEAAVMMITRIVLNKNFIPE